MTSYTQGLIVGLVVILSVLHGGQTQTNPACRNRLDLLIVIDASGSVEFNNYYNWPQAKELTKGYLESFNIGRGQVHVAVMQVSDQARIVHRFSSAQSQFEIFAVIDRLQYTRGSTNLADAFDRARTEVFDIQRGGSRGDVQRVMILLSDGQPTVNVPRTIPAANELKQQRRVLIIPVGISAGKGGYNEVFLRQIASDPNEPIVNYNQLQLTSQMLTSHNLDIAIALDCSGSILFLDINNWWYAKLFLDYLVQSLRSNNPGRNAVRVATVLFNETATLAFNLDRFDDTVRIVDAIRQLEYCGGKTNMAAAMRMVGQQVFRLSDPGRMHDPNRKMVMLMVTDGVSTVEPGRVQYEANQLKEAGVNILAVVVNGKRQIDRTELAKLASVISEGDTGYGPALIEVTDYRSLGSQIRTVVDRICQIPGGRLTETDMLVSCHSSCIVGRTPLVGFYQYCSNGAVSDASECQRFLDCNGSGQTRFMNCPPNSEFDNGLKQCTWHSCTCPGNIRRCYHPEVLGIPGI